MEIIGWIVASLIILTLFYALCRSFPWIRWVVAVGIGIASFALWGIWWVSILAVFISLGLILSMTETKTKRGNAIKCGNCGYDMIDILSEDDQQLTYKCRKCGQKGAYHLHR